MLQEDESDHEFKELIREERERIEFEYSMKFIDFAKQVGAGDADRAGPIEVWKGIASALADCSGLRVVLQAPVLALSEDGKYYRCDGYQEVFRGDPALFVTPADWLL